MKSIKKNLLSVAVVIFFLTIAVASSKQKLPFGSFNVNEPKGETITNDSMCVILNSGEIFCGTKRWQQSGAIVKDLVKIDGKSFPMKSIKGMYSGMMYHERVKTTFPKRVLYGKINLYYLQEWQSTSKGRSILVQYLFWQKGDNSPLHDLRNWKDVKKSVEDCPQAYELANKAKGELKKELAKDRLYLWRVFETYNSECKTLANK